MIELALIGAGPWGRNYIKTIKQIPEIRLAQLSSRNPHCHKLAPPGCEIFQNWQEIIQKKNVDGIIIAAPSKFQTQIGIAALDGGFPVMFEKPLALNLKDLDRINKAAKRSGLPTIVDHTLIFHPAFERLKELNQNLDEITAISSNGWNWGPFRENIDPLWDWGPHDLSLCLELLEATPEIVKAERIESAATPQGLRRMYNLVLNFPEGAGADLVFGNCRSPKRRYFEVITQDRSFIFDDCSDQKLIARSKGNISYIDYSEELPLTHAVKKFVSGIKGKTDHRLGFNLANKVCHLLATAETQMNE